MIENLKIGAVNQLEEGTLIYKEGQLLQSVALILRGSVSLYNDCFRVKLGPGDFIAVSDLYLGKYSTTSEAKENCSIYVFPAHKLEDVRNILSANKDYKGFMVKSLNRYLCAIYENYYSSKVFVNEMYERILQIKERYEGIVTSYGKESELGRKIQDITPFTTTLPVTDEWMESIKEYKGIPTEVVNTYYVYLTNTAVREIEEKIKIVTILQDTFKKLISYLGMLNEGIYSEDKSCLFTVLCSEVKGLAPSHSNYDELVGLVDEVVEMVNLLEDTYEEYLGKNCTINRMVMEKMYYTMLTDSHGEEQVNDSHSEEEILRDVSHSLDQILSFGKIDQETKNKFAECIDQFVALKDRQVITDEVRQLRKEIASLFFFAYKKVFLEAYHGQATSKVVEMFLQFGYVDERLLTKEQLIELYQLQIAHPKTHYCSCYTMVDWLTLIYEGKKEPSRNEFDLDYRDYIRSMKGEGKITPNDEVQYLQNVDMKLEYEISNMFRHNMKLTNGKISTFVPILYAENLPLNIQKYFLSIGKIDEAIRDITQIDYSAFYREIIYSNPSQGITKELIMKECLPDVILFPTCGTNGVMWQEIANKRRDSSGRFCLPIFHEANLNDSMIKMIGRYRWELCRTLQGLAWNDIKNKCLTSEYNDYLQFYRKNKDLSEDKKEKIKQQLHKVRNNTRECFVTDYEQWIKYEASGSVRLNKITREIFATYCPFQREIRNKLMERANYSEAMARFERLSKSRVRVLEAKVLALRKHSYEVPKELLDTVEFYFKK